jgi:hypothetical protein
MELRYGVKGKNFLVHRERAQLFLHHAIPESVSHFIENDLRIWVVCIKRSAVLKTLLLQVS